MAKLTVSNALDMLALGGNAVQRAATFAVDGDGAKAKTNLLRGYAAYDDTTGTITPDYLVWGYGGVLNTVLEKKINRFLGITRPRSKIEHLGDAMDYAAYFGKAGMDAYTNRGNVNAAANLALKTLNGVDYGAPGLAGWCIVDKLKYQTLPYFGQRLLRKMMRAHGIKFSLKLS